MILTDDEIGSCFRFSRFEMCRAIESAILAKLKKKAHEITENEDHWLYDAPCGDTVDTFVKAVYRALLED